MDAQLRKLAVKLHHIGAIKYGNFTTKVGLQTPIYIDLRVIISDPDLLEELSLALWSLSDEEDKHHHVCGVPYTALPLATTISLKSRVPMLIRRKEAKSYGTKKMIEGLYEKGDTAVIIEDIITSGSSIIETVKDLKKEGLNVNKAFVIVNREQGGKKNLEDAGITVKYLFTMTQLVDYLYQEGIFTQQCVDEVKEYIKNSQIPMKVKVENERLIQSFSTRAKASKNQSAIKLFKLMEQKQTTLCLAADFVKSQEILDIAQLAGPHIAVLKVHIDIVEDYNKDLIQNLKNLAKTHNFMIMEDRKFADIGQVVSQQFRNGIYSIAEWADLITVHPVPGKGIIQGIGKGLDECSEDKGIFIVAEMSSAGALTTGEYVEKAVKEVADSEMVTGFVCQTNIFKDPGLIQLTPGVKLVESADDLGQQYNTPNAVVDKGADLIVVGRGITQAKDQLSAVIEYKKVLWEAYKKRVVENTE
ncbi:uridine 5'-monophosphate synthase [Trichogramma pretiosum]|uniref:uridine 5'-monophosphate synthase n=1 Tax=Trichogramma pretiosum TaxID=7493 RepID=UPI0006C9C883|nr:uridine 5'-monophosphate synthase [Trichogramma pretiosum]